MSTLHVLTDLVSHLPAQNVPNPGPAPLPGKLGAVSDTVIGWVKTVLIAGGVLGLMICAAMILFGRRNRNALATDGVLGIPWVIGALGLMGSASSIVGAFL